MKYIVTSEQFIGELIFEFDTEDRLCHFSNRAQLTEKQWTFVMKLMPAHSSWVRENFTSDYAKIQEVKTDLSFENFWEAYAYKINGRSTCEKLWKALSEADKLAALNFIPRYNGQVAQANVARKYPETYLRTKCWIN